jgi:hypothetical protein
MANATAITVRELALNGTSVGTADTFDTGTSPVTVTAPVNALERVILEVTNLSASNLAVSVLGDQHAPAFRGTPPALTKTGIAQNAVVVLGPFDSGRFFDGGAGGLQVTLTPTSTINAAVRCFRLPRA